LGIIGTGGMANTHARCLSALEGVSLVACCDVREVPLKEFAAKHRIPRTYTDFREMLREEQLDGVSNVTPDALHAPVALAAAEAGVPILSEKPLATSYEEGRRMLEAVEKSGIINMVNFSYRDSSAMQEAALRIRKGDLGRVLHVETSYLQCWLSSTCWGDWRTSGNWLWRLSSAHGSLGTLGDIGCHLYDGTILLAGPISEVFCRLKTFDKGAPDNRIGEYLLDANDSFNASVEFTSGALGVVHSSRWATGHKNSLLFRVYGDEGAVEIDLDQAWDRYRICAGRKHVNEAAWDTVKAKPSPNNYERFVRAIRTGEPDPSDFANALRIQACMHYSVLSSEQGKPVRVE
jgi:predicted dehydrogenase